MSRTGISTGVFISVHLFVWTSSCVIEVNSKSLGAADEERRVLNGEMRLVSTTSLVT